eukprot:jgi/Botrbrau1/18642/Bobra.0367s0078.1
MVKEVVLSTVFPGVTVKEQHQLCSGPDNMIEYHKVVHNNDRIEVGPWEPEYPDPSDPHPTCSRAVTMWQPFEAPYVVRRASGGDWIKLEDVHVSTFDRSTGNIHQISSPRITIPTLGELQAASMVWDFFNAIDRSGQPCVQVTARISADTSDLKWLWAVRSTLEKIFVAESIKAVEGFFQHTGGRLRNYVRLRDAGTPPPKTAPWPLDPPEVFQAEKAAFASKAARRPPPTHSHVLDSQDLEFFDAQDHLSDGEEAHSPRPPTSSASTPAGPPPLQVANMGDRTPLKELDVGSNLVLVNTLPSPKVGAPILASKSSFKDRSKAALRKVLSSVKPHASRKAASPN